MQQYLQLLRDIKEQGTHKSPARENMPGTISLFGYQMRFNLQDGFPILTTKEIWWKGVVIELLWFLRGDSNIKYLVDNGVMIWCEDAYSYYLKKCRQDKNHIPIKTATFEEFIQIIKDDGSFKNLIQDNIIGNPHKPEGYNNWGDTGEQYPRLWRKWEETKIDYEKSGELSVEFIEIDQVKELINGLQNNPESRRHILTAWNPATLDDMALNACHCLVQFNARKLTIEQRLEWASKNYPIALSELANDCKTKEEADNHYNYTFDLNNVPKYYLDCQMYQRSGDVFLGVPFNISSYSLLTHLIAKMCNMEPGYFIHSLGDVHIYDNHMESVDEQLQRTPSALPQLKINERSENGYLPDHFDKYVNGGYDLYDFINKLTYHDFKLINYNPQSKIKGELSTGLKK